MRQLNQVNQVDQVDQVDQVNQMDFFIPTDVLFHIFHYIDYCGLARLSQVNRNFCFVCLHLMKNFPKEFDYWAWANERLSQNKSAIRLRDRKSLQQMFPMILNRSGFKLKLEIQKGVLFLFVKTIFNKVFKVQIMVLDKVNFFDWWLENEKCSFIPARLNINEKDMDVVSCSLRKTQGERVFLIIDLIDPIDIKITKEDCFREVWNPLSETYYLLPNIHFASIFIQKSILCPDDIWAHKFDTSDHPETEPLKWSMIRSHKLTGQTSLYLFEHNVQIRSVILNCPSNHGGHGVFKSVGAGKYVIQWQPIGDLTIYVIEEDRQIIFDHENIKLFTFGKMFETHLVQFDHPEKNDLIIVRDFLHQVFIVDIKMESINILLKCAPHVEYPLYVNHKHKLLNWVDLNEKPKQIDLKKFVCQKN